MQYILGDRRRWSGNHAPHRVAPGGLQLISLDALSEHIGRP